MKHLDEGTIHAWLDGALNEEEARYCEEHTASCEACRALVAEARGLVAGASRILSALDDVPAGVVPAGTARPKGRRNWTRTLSWAMAAALVLAVGVKVGTRNRASQYAVPQAPAPVTTSTPTKSEAATNAVQPAAGAPKPALKAAKTRPGPTPSAERRVTASNSPPTAKTADAVAAVAAAPAAQLSAKRRDVQGTDSAARQLKLGDVVTTGVSEPRASARQAQAAVGGVSATANGAAAAAVPAIRGGVAGGVAVAELDTNLPGLRAVCYTNGVEHLMLDTAGVGGDMPGWRVLRSGAQVAGRWRMAAGDSITLIFTQPMQRMLVGVVRPGGLDLTETGSAAGVWMGRTDCGSAGR